MAFPFLANSRNWKPAKYAAPAPGLAWTAAPGPWTAMARVALAALMTAALAHAQLTSGPIWTLMTGQGVYRDWTVGALSIAIYAITALLACVAPPSALATLEQDKVFRWLCRGAVLLGFSIIYPAAFHYFYDLPRWSFIGGTLLALVLGLLSCFRCQALIPFSFLVTLAVGSFMNVPHYTWDITDLRHTLNALALLGGIITATALPYWLSRIAELAGRARTAASIQRWQPDQTTLLVLTGFSCLIAYFYAGFGKVAISSQSLWLVDGLRWIWLERLDKFFQLFFHMGCTWLVPAFSPQAMYDLLGNVWVRGAACAVVLFGELAVIAFLFSRRLCIAGLVACQLLHLGFAVLCGTYFSHWFLINAIFIGLFSRRAFDQLRQQWTPFQRLGLTAAAILVCPMVFQTSVLAWSTDRSQLVIFTWHASPLSAEMARDDAQVCEPQIDPNQFFPYEKSFQMSWRFARLMNELDASSRTATLRETSYLGAFCSWYKLRLVGEWHEHLGRGVTLERLESDLQRLLTRYHAHRAQDERSIFPVYYTHMAYNSRLMPRAALRRCPVQSYVLMRQELHSGHGSVYLTSSPTPLCRIGLRDERRGARGEGRDGAEQQRPAVTAKTSRPKTR